MSLMTKFKAWVTRRPLVILIGDDGKTYLTIERTDLVGKKYAHVYDRWKIGHVILIEGQRPMGETHYIASWRYYK